MALGGAWVALQLQGEPIGRLVHVAGIISVLGMFVVLTYWAVKNKQIPK